ncbi:MAG: YraN family protein [Chloroflexota bacterium]
MARSQQIGRLGETTAARFLKDAGYSILDRNYRCEYGEIDIVARMEEMIVFVEVKTRQSLKFGLPEESITRAKSGRLIQSAEMYLNENDLIDVDWRIDLVAIQVDSDNQIVDISHIIGAIDSW